MAFSLSTKSISSSSCKSISRLFAVRFQSSSPSPADLADDPLVRKFEDVIHRIVARRAAPDWLPFLPGSSYWVPPPPDGFSQLIEKLAYPLTDEQTLSTTTVRGWPSSDYFLEGVALNPLNTEASLVKLKPKAPLDESEAVKTSSNASETEDEEG